MLNEPRREIICHRSLGSGRYTARFFTEALVCLLLISNRLGLIVSRTSKKLYT